MKLITEYIDKDYFKVIDLDTNLVSEEYIRPWDSDLSQYIGGNHQKLRVISLREWQILELLTNVGTTHTSHNAINNIDVFDCALINFYDDFIRKTGDTSISTVAGYIIKIVSLGYAELYTIENNYIQVKTHNKLYLFHISDLKLFTKLVLMG